jgi:flagellar basal body-associated protein FliL
MFLSPTFQDDLIMIMIMMMVVMVMVMVMVVVMMFLPTAANRTCVLLLF